MIRIHFKIASIIRFGACLAVSDAARSPAHRVFRCMPPSWMQLLTFHSLLVSPLFQLQSSIHFRSIDFDSNFTVLFVGREFTVWQHRIKTADSAVSLLTMKLVERKVWNRHYQKFRALYNVFFCTISITFPLNDVVNSYARSVLSVAISWRGVQDKHCELCYHHFVIWPQDRRLMDQRSACNTPKC